MVRGLLASGSGRQQARSMGNQVQSGTEARTLRIWWWELGASSSRWSVEKAQVCGEKTGGGSKGARGR